VNDPAGVSIDSLCRPTSSPQATAAGCTGEASAGVCKACSGSGFFLFMGGCYSTKSNSGSKICTAAEGGKCTACKTDGSYIFQTTATTVMLGNECILCSDTTNRDGYKGVANCQMCTAPSATGAATCSACQDGYYKDTNGTCAQCNTNSCLTCETSATQCTSCPKGKYLKDGNTCVEEGECTTNQYYLDKVNRKCLACSTIAGCTQCTLDQVTGKPKCTTCGSEKIPRTALDGTSTCVTKGYTECQGDNNELFMKEDTTACLLCGDATTGTEANDKGKAGCKTCTKSANGAPPTCTACKEGFIFEESSKGCSACGANCATCSEATTESKCLTCKEGFFLAGSGEGRCISCETGSDSGYAGVLGCTACTTPASPGPASCSTCKIGYALQGATCVKACEDDSACGGTAGACGAIVVGDDGNMKYYCSLCGKAGEVPINGLCTSNTNGNQCSNGACQSCAANYFLYMGGCYNTQTTPGSLMCSKATTAGVCETPNANSRYFAVPGAAANQQSVLACGNPLGTTVGDSAYVGVEGCRTCEAPTAATGMASAKCTACDEGKPLTGSGYGCVTCSIAGCSACRADNMCGACGDGYRLEGDTCVRTGGNLSTGAIAGISVAAVVVVGGLVGFLCWWFVCRGKA
ncbi:Variant-specific surface protein, partial [Giardia duodenalis]